MLLCANLLHDSRPPPGKPSETLLLAFIFYLLFLKKRPRRDKSGTLSPAEEEELIAEWKPEPLVPTVASEDFDVIHRTPIIEAFNGNMVRAWSPKLPPHRSKLLRHAKPWVGIDAPERAQVKLEGRPGEVLNLVSFDFLGMSNRREMKQAAKETLEE